MAVISRLKIDVVTEPNRVLGQFEDNEQHTTGERLLTILHILEVMKMAVMQEKYRIDQTGTILIQVEQK